MKRGLAGLVLLVVMLVPRVTAQADSSSKPDPLANAKVSVGLVYANDRLEGVRHQGSCVAVASRVIITAFHVSKYVSPADITIKVEGKVFHPLGVVPGDELDVTLFLIPKEDELPVWVKCDPKGKYPVGSAITAIGFAGLSSIFEVIPGKVDANPIPHRKHGFLHGIQDIRVTQAFKEGMSGGGAFDANGYLVGIILAIEPDNGNKGVIIPLNQPNIWYVEPNVPKGEGSSHRSYPDMIFQQRS